MATRDWAALGAPRTVEIVGTQQVVNALRQLGVEAPKALASGMYEEAEGTMTLAKTLTPVKTGNLRGSGHVSLPEINGPVVELTMGFGGPAGSGNHGGETNAENVGYAVYVHERVELHHPVGQAKFLEAAFQQREQGLAARLANALQATLTRIRNRGAA